MNALLNIIRSGSFIGTALLLLSTSCAKEQVTGKIDFSRYYPNETAITETDRWIANEITKPYNIEVIWRYQDSETSHDYNEVPPLEENVIPFLKVFKEVFLGSFIEIYEDKGVYKHPDDFIKIYAPKQIILSGEWRYLNAKTTTFGVAEGGKAIYLTGINYWDKGDNLKMFVRNTFHIFGHILIDTKQYPLEFEKISVADYATEWSKPSNEAQRKKIAKELGFVSDYARKDKVEDFIETFAYFVMTSEEEWDSYLESIDGSIAYDDAYNLARRQEGRPEKESRLIAESEQRKAITKARNAIWEKLNVVDDYLRTQWTISIYDLRDIVQKKFAAVSHEKAQP